MLTEYFLLIFSMLFRILWTATTSVIAFQATLFLTHSKISYYIPKPVKRPFWWEDDILAQFPSRSLQETQLPLGRRVWGSQQKMALCQPICVTDVPQHQQSLVSVKIWLCWHLLSIAIFGQWNVSKGWAGHTPSVCSIAPFPGCLRWLLAGCGEG